MLLLLVSYIRIVPVSDHSAGELGLAHFESHGHSARCLDVSPILWPHASAFRETQYEDSRRIRVDDLAQLEALLGERSQVVLPLVPFSPETAMIYQAISKSGTRWFALHLAPVPEVGQARGPSKFLSPKAYFQAARWRLHKLMRLLTRTTYSQPEKVFLAGKCLLPTDVYPPIRATVPSAPITSADFSRYLEVKRRGLGRNGTCVYVASNPFNRVERDMFGQSQLGSADVHFSAIRRLFDMVEDRTGLQVVVAEHPHHGPSPEQGLQWYGRKVVCGQTPELVAQSDLVICRGSNAVAYPVLFRKPILWFTDSKVFEPHMNSKARNFARILRGEILDIHDDAALQRLPLVKIAADDGAFREYEELYLRHPDAPDKPSWEILCAALHELDGGLTCR